LPRRPARIAPEAAPRPPIRRRRYWLAATLGVLALASPLAIAAVPAAAQGIQFSTVTGDGSGDLAITVSSDYPLTDWTLSLADGSNTYTMDDFTDFVDQDSFTADTPQTYELPTADATAVFGSSGIGLPPGQYTVTATAATDSNSPPDTLPSAQTLTGTFNFLAQPTVTVNSASSSSNSPIFYSTAPSQSVAVTGQITGCTTVACPSSWSGTSVTITDVTASANPSWSGSADANGDFSVSVTGNPGDSYSVSVPAVTGTSLAATAPSDAVDVPQYAATSITASATAAPYGTQSITGQLTYQPQSGFNPVDAPAGVSVTATAGKATVTTTTGSNGDFTMALPALTGTTTWLLSTQNDLESSPFLAGTQSSVGATQLWPTQITGFAASLDDHDYLTVSGCMTTTISEKPPVEHPLMGLQYRTRDKGPWTTFGWLDTTSLPGCAGVAFSAGGTAPVTSAYYRAYFPGDDVYASAVSASTPRVWIYPTRFTPFRASPRSVASGGKVTISGTLQYEQGSTWHGYGDQRITVIFSTNGRTRWYIPPAGTFKTNSKGAFSAAFVDGYGTAYWSAYFAGNSTHLLVYAPNIRVKAHGHISDKPIPTGLPGGRLNPALGSASSGYWPFFLSDDPLLTIMSS
jgi:hypothetical protein